MEDEEKDAISSDIPVWERFLLNIYEAAEYYHIGENEKPMSQKMFKVV
jgi:hypothetical protein